MKYVEEEIESLKGKKVHAKIVDIKGKGDVACQYPYESLSTKSAPKVV